MCFSKQKGSISTIVLCSSSQLFNLCHRCGMSQIEQQANNTTCIQHVYSYSIRIHVHTTRVHTQYEIISCGILCFEAHHLLLVWQLISVQKTAFDFELIKNARQKLRVKVSCQSNAYDLFNQKTFVTSTCSTTHTPTAPMSCGIIGTILMSSHQLPILLDPNQIHITSSICFWPRVHVSSQLFSFTELVNSQKITMDTLCDKLHTNPCRIFHISLPSTTFLEVDMAKGWAITEASVSASLKGIPRTLFPDRRSTRSTGNEEHGGRDHEGLENLTIRLNPNSLIRQESEDQDQFIGLLSMVKYLMLMGKLILRGNISPP